MVAPAVPPQAPVDGRSLLLKVFRLLDVEQRRGAVALFGLMLVGTFLEALGVGLVVPAISLMMQVNLIERYPLLRGLVASFGTPTQTTLVLAAVALLLLVFLVKNTFLAFLAWRQSCFAFQAQARMSQRLFSHYLGQPYIFHVQHNSAQLIRNVTTEASMFATHALLPGMLLIAEAFVLGGIGLLLLLAEPTGALVVVAVVGSAAWLFYRLTRARSVRWGRSRQLHEGMRVQQIQQGLGGVKDVKVLGREEYFLAGFACHNAANAEVAQRQSALQQMPRLWLELLAVGGLAILVFSMVGRNRPLQDVVPVLGLFAAAAFRLMPSLNRVLTSLQGLRYGLPVIELLSRELALAASSPQTLPLRPAADATAAFTNAVQFREVSYRYPGALQPALDALSLEIRAGETLGVIGSSGSGKSTLVDVMLGLLTPDAGRVEVDGGDIAADLRGWQRRIGYVPQTIYLTDDSLRRNVAFGVSDDEIDAAAVSRALAFAQLDTLVATLPDGLQTCVGERGVRLSGGQRQRIGIARALYHNPPILVLDEATSALDVATEAEVMKAVNALHGNKTIVIVAHRLSTVERCDRIIRLEAGRVVAEGSPEQLLPALEAVGNVGSVPINNRVT